MTREGLENAFNSTEAELFGVRRQRGVLRKVSMWRAYGNPTAMALVLKHDLFTRLPNVLSNFGIRNDGSIF